MKIIINQLKLQPNEKIIFNPVRFCDDHVTDCSCILQQKEGEGKNVPTSSEVAKILDKSDLTNADYSVLLDYVEGAFDEMLPLMEEAQKAGESGDFDKAEEIAKKLKPSKRSMT